MGQDRRQARTLSERAPRLKRTIRNAAWSESGRPLNMKRSSQKGRAGAAVEPPGGAARSKTASLRKYKLMPDSTLPQSGTTSRFILSPSAGYTRYLIFWWEYAPVDEDAQELHTRQWFRQTL